jgi:hypothetical protein
MARDTRTVAMRNKAIRQEAVREQMATYGHHTQATKIIEKLSDVEGKLSPTNATMDSVEVQRLGKALDGHIKLVAKYLGDQKEINYTGEVNHIHDEDDDAIQRRLNNLIQRAKEDTTGSSTTH